MRMFVKYTFLFLVPFFFAFMLQERSQQVVIKTKVDLFTADNMGNIYVAKNEELIKFQPNGKLFARYSNLKLGDISSVDATNPLKVMIYYKDFQQIVFLDDQLSSNSEVISLESLGHEQTDLVCTSNNNSFWLFDKQNNELTRFNENSKKIASTGNLKQILKTELEPNYMHEFNGFLYLNCPQHGIYVFDMFGAFVKLITLKELKGFIVDEDLIYFKRDTMLCSYNHKLFEEACSDLKLKDKSIGIEYRKPKIYIGYRDSIIIKSL